MPLPKPKTDESHKDWIDRCMGNAVMLGDWPDNNTRYAVCENIWKDKKTMKPNKELRTLAVDAAEIRVAFASDGTPKGIEGYAAVFESETEIVPGLREKIARGAFASALARPDDVRGLFNHDSNHILGRTKSGTLRLSQDDKGLRFSLDLPDTQTAADVATSIDRGDIDGCSFSFRMLSEQWDDGGAQGDLRTLLDLELFDVGPVTFPAYTDTSVAVRSRDDWRAEQVIQRATPRLNEARQKLAEL